MQIFLSYATDDKAFAEQIAILLRARGHRVFPDRGDLLAGRGHEAQIEQAVDRSNLFLFLVSPASIENGQPTLTELEFARRKWRRTDRHVLPVMVRPTPSKDIPDFLKSVPILEPKGNLAAEVVAAVGPRAQALAKNNVLVYGGVGVISGFLTPQANDGLAAILPYWNIFDVPAPLWLAGGAFAAALVGALSYSFRFRSRHLAIVFFVLVGWYLALGICSWNQAEPPKPSAQIADALQQNQHCAQIDSAASTAIDTSLEIECLKLRLSTAESIIINLDKNWRSMWFFLVSGAVGALITTLGVSLAVRGFSPVQSYLLITVVGATIAIVWFIFAAAVPLNDEHLYALFVPWQATVAGVIGRSIGV